VYLEMGFLCKNHMEASERHGKIIIKVILRELREFMEQ
jgi:hypothetical protein